MSRTLAAEPALAPAPVSTPAPVSAPVSAPAPVNARMLGAAWTVTAVFMLSNSPTPFYVIWQRALGFPAATLTIVFALYIAGLLATLLVSGQLSDRLGRKAVLLPGLAAALAACLLFANASSVAMLVLARVLTGIAVGVAVSAGMALVVDAGGAMRRRQAALLASVAMVLGAGLGPLLAGAAAQTFAHPVPYVFGMEFLLLSSAFIFVARLPSTRQIPAAAARARIRLPSVPVEHRHHVWSGIAVFGPGISATSFVLALGPSLLARMLDTSSPLLAGAMACAMFVVATGVQFALRNLGSKPLLGAGSLITIAAMSTLWLAVHTSSAWLLIAAALLAGAGQGLGQLGGLMPDRPARARYAQGRSECCPEYRRIPARRAACGIHRLCHRPLRLADGCHAVRHRFVCKRRGFRRCGVSHAGQARRVRHSLFPHS